MTWRLLDPEPQTAAWHVACDTALLEARAGGLSPDTLRFFSCDPPSLLLGAHQFESGPDGCRRITGGPSVVLDSNTVGWTLTLSRKSGIDEMRRRVAAAAAEALRPFGYPADPGPRGLRLSRRVVCPIVETSEGAALLIQGFLFVAGTRPPAISLFEAAGGSAPSTDEVRQALARSFAERFEVSLEKGALTTEERALLAAKIPEMRAADWVRSVRPPEGETFRGIAEGDGVAVCATVLPGERRNALRRVVFSGDFCAHPRSAIRDLQKELGDTAVDEAPARIQGFFLRAGAEVPGLSPGDFFTALSLAYMKRRITLSTAADPAAWKRELPT